MTVAKLRRATTTRAAAGVATIARKKERASCAAEGARKRIRTCAAAPLTRPAGSEVLRARARFRPDGAAAAMPNAVRAKRASRRAGSTCVRAAAKPLVALPRPVARLRPVAARFFRIRRTAELAV